ncbi:hypothetical protein DFJ73DRAFT_960915 [Zopfochytrium polystomum]|nr:hypothetical protein DFJ73DRAFT_960915 [Zopfochytrium polystomum]
MTTTPPAAAASQPTFRQASAAANGCLQRLAKSGLRWTDSSRGFHRRFGWAQHHRIFHFSNPSHSNERKPSLAAPRKAGRRSPLCSEVFAVRSRMVRPRRRLRFRGEIWAAQLVSDNPTSPSTGGASQIESKSPRLSSLMALDNSGAGKAAPGGGFGPENARAARILCKQRTVESWGPGNKPVTDGLPPRSSRNSPAIDPVVETIDSWFAQSCDSAAASGAPNPSPAEAPSSVEEEATQVSRPSLPGECGQVGKPRWRQTLLYQFKDQREEGLPCRRRSASVRMTEDEFLDTLFLSNEEIRLLEALVSIARGFGAAYLLSTCFLEITICRIVRQPIEEFCVIDRAPGKQPPAPFLLRDAPSQLQGEANRQLALVEEERAGAHVIRMFLNKFLQWKNDSGQELKYDNKHGNLKRAAPRDGEEEAERFITEVRCLSGSTRVRKQLDRRVGVAERQQTSMMLRQGTKQQDAQLPQSTWTDSGYTLERSTESLRLAHLNEAVHNLRWGGSADGKSTWTLPITGKRCSLSPLSSS